jgi:arabinan endo-1,5-alpha-L-arabinosidase
VHDAPVPVTAGPFERIHDPSVGEAERWYVNDHTFIRDHTGTWHLIGITHAEPANPFDELHLCHATATDLRGPWTKHPFALSTVPSVGESHLWAPHVISHDDRYWMFVCAGGPSPQEYRIHLATSDDCWTWTRHDENPLVVDGYEARDPMVLRIGYRWVMYYTATTEPEGGNHIVVATESDDLVHWSGRRTVYTADLVGTGGGPTESPFVVERDGRWYLFVGPSRIGDAMARIERGEDPDWRSVYSTTLVLESDDPFHFSADAVAGRIDSHAAEIIVDVDGSTWVSHCGWGMKGVYLAPLHWD